MSNDIVDDLHAAEDRIGTVTATLNDLIVEAHRAIGTRDVVPLLQRTKDAQLVRDAGYCRPSCFDHDHDDPTDLDAEDCGCPSHEARADEEANMICPLCHRPVVGEEPPGYDGPFCSPLSGCDAWEVIASWDHDKRDWRPQLRLVPEPEREGTT